MLVIIPNCVRDAINARLDEAIAKMPEAAVEREQMYQQLLAYYDNYGTVPVFEVYRKSDPPSPDIDCPVCAGMGVLDDESVCPQCIGVGHMTALFPE